jgi:hypothetical protein
VAITPAGGICPVYRLFTGNSALRILESNKRTPDAQMEKRERFCQVRGVNHTVENDAG